MMELDMSQIYFYIWYWEYLRQNRYGFKDEYRQENLFPETMMEFIKMSLYYGNLIWPQ